MKIEEKLALGTLVLRIILAQGGNELASSLREVGEGVTIVNGEALVGGERRKIEITSRTPRSNPSC